MSFKPLPPMRGMSGGGFQLSNDSASTRGSEDSSSTSRTQGTIQSEDLGRKIWSETQWAHLSRQARDLGLPKLPYFDPGTMLLSKEVNNKLWRQLVSHLTDAPCTRGRRNS